MPHSGQKKVSINVPLRLSPISLPQLYPYINGWWLFSPEDLIMRIDTLLKGTSALTWFWTCDLLVTRHLLYQSAIPPPHLHIALYMDSILVPFTPDGEWQININVLPKDVSAGLAGIWTINLLIESEWITVIFFYCFSYSDKQT